MLRAGQFTPQLKLLYHSDRINDWLNGRTIYPITVEFDLSNACNQKCNFCTFKYIKDKSVLRTDIVFNAIDSFAFKQVKAINWTGGGEPLIHRYFSDIAYYAKNRGIKQGLFTNGTLLTERIDTALLETHDWVRVSIDAGTKETYKKIRGTDDFNLVLHNVKELVLRTKASGSETKVGIGFVVTAENYQEIPEFSEMVRKTGCDYGQIKPCINNFQCDWQYESNWWSQTVIPLIEGCSRKNKRLVVNDYKFKELLNENKSRQYEKCYGHNFCPCIGATGDVWLCTHMRDIQEFSLGNLYEQSFERIWESEKRQEIIKKINFNKCQFCCKNHEINKALYAIKHPETRNHGDFL